MALTEATKKVIFLFLASLGVHTLFKGIVLLMDSIINKKKINFQGAIRIILGVIIIVFSKNLLK